MGGKLFHLSSVDVSLIHCQFCDCLWLIRIVLYCMYCVILFCWSC